jgi:ABC-type amino acid transport system permease subunit
VSICAGIIIGPALVILHVSKLNSVGLCMSRNKSSDFFNFNNYSSSNAVTLCDLLELDLFSMCSNLWVVTVRIFSYIPMLCQKLVLSVGPAH